MIYTHAAVHQGSVSKGSAKTLSSAVLQIATDFGTSSRCMVMWLALALLWSMLSVLLNRGENVVRVL